MRIIAGKYKRTPINTLAGEEITRPTRDMVKEALFSSIAIFSDTCFLDLFAGSGAIGLEALSRGAAEVVFNDINREAVKVIKSNLMKVKENRMVLNLDYKNCLREMTGRVFDYIYCDPPYAFAEYEEIFSYVKAYGLLKEKGIMILEVRKNTDLDDVYPGFVKFKEQRYGISKLVYYRKEEKND